MCWGFLRVGINSALPSLLVSTPKKYEVTMKIKYIKDAPNGPAGMTDDVSDFHGNILVLTGFAEIDDSIELELPTEPKPKTKSKATTKTDNE